MKVLNTALAAAFVAAQLAAATPYCEAKPAKAVIQTSGTIGLVPIYLQNVAGVGISFRLDDSNCVRQTPTYFQCSVDISGVGPTIVGPAGTPMNFSPQFAIMVKGSGSGAVETVIRVTDLTSTLLVSFHWSSSCMVQGVKTWTYLVFQRAIHNFWSRD